MRSHNNGIYALEKLKYSYLEIYKMRSSKTLFLITRLTLYAFASDIVLLLSLISDVSLWVSRRFVPHMYVRAYFILICF